MILNVISNFNLYRHQQLPLYLALKNIRPGHRPLQHHQVRRTSQARRQRVGAGAEGAPLRPRLLWEVDRDEGMYFC